PPLGHATMRAMPRFIFPYIVYGASAVVAAITISAQAPAQPDWQPIEEEALRHFQTLVRMNTTDPPGGEKPAAEYLKQVLEQEGIPTQLFALEPHRPNVVARLKGNGKKRPLLILGHTDTVNIDEKKWSFPPFSAARDSGYIYGRGTVDDKDNVTAALMAMLTLKCLNVPLDRDVIFLSEAGEEGTTRVGRLGTRRCRSRRTPLCICPRRSARRHSGASRSGSTRRRGCTSSGSRRSRAPRRPHGILPCSATIRRSQAPPMTTCSNTSRA